MDLADFPCMPMIYAFTDFHLNANPYECICPTEIDTEGLSTCQIFDGIGFEVYTPPNPWPATLPSPILRSTRVGAAAEEHDLDYFKLNRNLIKSGLHLRPVDLQDLAIWEPRTFKCLTDIAKAKHKLEASPEVAERLQAPENVITRGML
ncbi:hypothetical protein AVEN_231852-1 [Araneus ventricosus]|uniref:Uncharacterized protein n=1 Tax=Araneus ventricosus TaxID=182803 RepID=A0A4Y2LJN2_ARAVE|nr:hypothetical protein AVEN_231852-1 [Araneus ventricosus]